MGTVGTGGARQKDCWEEVALPRPEWYDDAKWVPVPPTGLEPATQTIRKVGSTIELRGPLALRSGRGSFPVQTIFTNQFHRPPSLEMGAAECRGKR